MWSLLRRKNKFEKYEGRKWEDRTSNRWRRKEGDEEKRRERRRMRARKEEWVQSRPLPLHQPARCVFM
jgi:hypothetical protein